MSRRSKVDDRCEAVLIALRQIIRESDIHSKRIAKRSGLTTPQLVVLRAIERLGEVTTREVSHNVSLSQATVTLILDHLAAKSLIERYRSARDRRVVHTRLTRLGETAVRSSSGLLHEHFVDRFRRLPVNKQKEIVDNLQEVAEMMRTGAPSALAALEIDQGGAETALAPKR